MQDIDFKLCQPYMQGKLYRKPFTKFWHSSKLFEAIHMKIYGPLKVKAYKGI